MDRSRLPLTFETLRAAWRSTGVFLMLLTLVGCGGTFGRLVHDEAVDQIFEELTVLPDHRYYYTGSDDRPDAIIAIDERFTLATTLWKPVENIETQLRKWINYRSTRARHKPYTYGRYILDDKGQRVGYWYALKDWWDFATIRMVDEATVEITRPSNRQRRRPMFDRDHV